MFLTTINMPVWAAVLLGIFYGLMGALIGVSIFRKKYSSDMESLIEAYEDLDAECDGLLSFYCDHDFNSTTRPTQPWLYVPKIFDPEDKPIMVDTSFALRFKRGEYIGKLINLIEENYRPDQEVTMRDILDFCYCPSCAEDIYFGWKASDILEQYRCIQETDNDPDSYWRMKLPTPHVINQDLFPYPVEIIFYDPEDFLKKYEEFHKEEAQSDSDIVMVPLVEEAK